MTKRWIGGLAVLALACAGCGAGAGDPGTPGSSVVAVGTAPPPSAADRQTRIGQYRDCLQHNGVVLLDEATSEGMPQIDKGRTPQDKVAAAMDQCRQLLPAGDDAPKPAPGDIEVRQRYAQCIRDHGIPAYPDPDPVTGTEQLSDELSARLKTDPKMADALQACQSILAAGSNGKGQVGG